MSSWSSGGSSPLARGLPVYTSVSGAPLGIIPARAGFTAWRRSCYFLVGDHPRSRGGYEPEPVVDFETEGSSPLARGLLSVNGQVNSGVGSSPLARGLHHPADQPAGADGIIPARAGFTWVRVGGGYGCADHPRSRGVYSITTTSSICSSGSSPLARGLHDPRQGPRRDRGIIPARAGFTRQMWSPHVKSGDHPRSRGVYWLGYRLVC